MERVVTIGIDIGQKVDPTALVICEATRPGPVTEGIAPGLMRTTKPVGRIETSFTVRDLGRLPLGTSYPDVARKVVEVVVALQLRGIYRPRLMVDATGVGLPVVDILREALKGKPHVLIACMFTHGDRYTKEEFKRTASVGKAFLVSRLQALLQTGRIKLPDTEEARVLARELQDYEIRISEDANMKAGAFRVGTHDDLVTALGLAVLDDPIKEAQSRRLLSHSGV